MDDAAAIAAPPGAAADAVAAGGGVAPLRPAREVFQERSINLNDPWARVYLARGCGAILQAAGGVWLCVGGRGWLLTGRTRLP
jgi:hypothetical protein